jgi:hypothetical protein
MCSLMILRVSSGNLLEILDCITPGLKRLSKEAYLVELEIVLRKHLLIQLIQLEG